MSTEEQLALKKLYDPENYDIEAVRALLTRKHIAIEEEDADKEQGEVSIAEFYNQFLAQQQRGERR